MRLLLVTANYLPSIGGVEQHVHQVAKRLAKAGVDVTVLTTDRQGNLPARERQDDGQSGFTVLRVRARPAQKDIYFAPGMIAIIQEGGWDLMHLQGVNTLVAPLAMLAARQARLPYLVTFHTGGHSSALRNRLRGAQWQALRPLLAGAQRLVAVSRFEAEAFQQRLKLSKDRLVVIPNGSQLPRLAAPRPDEHDPGLIVSVGRLERYKGHQRVLAAMPMVLEDCPEARLRILGSGPYEADLQKQARALGLNGQVEIGPIPPEDRQGMAGLLSQAALVTLLSEYEAHPIAVMEALSLGRPVLVARTSGLNELVEAGLAEGIPLDSSPRQVAQAITGCLRQPRVRREVSLPTWDDCAASLHRLYQECLPA